MKLALEKLFFSQRCILTLFTLFFIAFSAQAQTVVCPSDTDLGTFDCNTIENAPGQINSLAAAMEAPYGIEITDALPETGVTTEDSAVLFYCDSDAREVTRLVIIYNDSNYNFSYDEGEEVATCTYVLNTEADTEAPTFSAPEDYETTCVLGIDTAVTGKAIVDMDPCPDLTVENVNFSDAPPVIGGCPGEKIYVRSWTATDPCGNANDPQTQTIIVKDLTGPEFTVPADINVPCGTDPADASITGDVTDGFDDCEGIEVAVQGRVLMNETQENTPCPGFTTYVKRWGAIDGCGNPTTKDQLIVVECPADCSNTDICVGDILAEPLPGECECQVVEEQVLGCTNPVASNYNPAANCDDDSCETCTADAGNMATALVTVCGGDNVNAPAEGTSVPAGSVLVYLLHDGTGTVIEDYNSTGTFVNDGEYPANVQLFISSAVGPDDGTGFPDLSDDCSDLADGTPVIFYDPIVISHMIDCDPTTATASVNFSITGGGPSASGGSYSVTGSFNGDVNPGEQNIISGISDGSTYSLTVINDGKGCTAFIDPQTVSCTKMPIELISYEGEAKKEGNLLKWVTASEIQNAYFTLERATTFSGFVKIHEQAGAGTYSLPSKYSYVDREAPNGLSYYRLKQTDIDGTTVEVGVVEIQRSEPTFDIINIHPIPVLDNFELYIDSEENQTVEVNVYNSIGELMHTNAYELTNAVNKVNIDVTTFGGGVYVVSAIVGEDIISHKIIKY